MRFVKAHGTGNDFVLLPDLDDTFALTAQTARALCDRHRGVGGDGVIRVAPARRPDGDVLMDYRNADGSVAEMCGNGVRCVAKHVLDHGHVRGDLVRVDTLAGVKVVEVAERHPDGTVASVRVDMGAPESTSSTTVELDGELHEVTTVSMGNPHAVLVVDDVADAPLATWAPEVARHFPDGANVEVIDAPSHRLVRGRVHERGVGETLASGTGASAMAVAAHVRGLADSDVTVSVPGGDLRVTWSDVTLHVTGPAEEVATGTLDRRWLALAELAHAEVPA